MKRGEAAKWRRYEHEKRKLEGVKMSPEEYERKLQEIVRRLKL